METRAHYVAVGAFVLAMVTLAFIAVLWVGRSELTTEHATYQIYFKGAVSGLRAGAPVEFSGVPVGKVSDIKIDRDNADTVRVTIELDANVPIHEDAAASLESNILSGVSYIQIAGGNQDKPLLMPQAGQKYAVIRPRRSGFGKVVAGAPQLVEKASETLDRVNLVLSEKNLQALDESLDNLRSFTGGLSDRSKDLAELSASANEAAQGLTKLIDHIDQSYTGDEGLATKLSGAITDFDKVARNLSDTNKQLQAALGDVRPGLRSFSQQTLNDVAGLVGEARQLISGLSRLAATIERDPSQVLFGDRREGYRPK